MCFSFADPGEIRGKEHEIQHTYTYDVQTLHCRDVPNSGTYDCEGSSTNRPNFFGSCGVAPSSSLVGSGSACLDGSWYGCKKASEYASDGSCLLFCPLPRRRHTNQPTPMPANRHRSPTPTPTPTPILTALKPILLAAGVLCDGGATTAVAEVEEVVLAANVELVL